jgi:transforming growth factor-beta-induced protein
MNAEKDIVDTAVAAGSFKTLAAALKAADLVEALKGKGPFTVFAPTDEAFAKLPAGTIESLLKPENKAKLQSILKFHVVSGEVLAKDVKTMPVATLDGQRAELKVTDGKVTIENATVTATDVQATNGVIHVIDTVIMPSDKNIVQTAVAAGSFKTLAKLLEQAELVDALSGPGPFTVFAPTDAAFAKLPKETVDSLLKAENKDKLAAILKFHVVSGRVFSDAAAKGATVKTLNGQEVTTKSEGGKVMVQNATVTAADIDSTNGVIHVIDTVILPK